MDVLLGESHQPGTYADDYNVMIGEEEDRAASRAFNQVFHQSSQSMAERAFNSIFHIPKESSFIQMDEDYDPWNDISARLTAPKDNLIQIDADI